MEQVLLSIETPNAPPMTYMVPSGGEISIGRDETCTVVLASPDISRRHVTINIQPSAIVVRDSSSNGTQVGTQRVFRSESRKDNPAGHSECRVLLRPAGSTR